MLLCRVCTLYVSAVVIRLSATCFCPHIGITEVTALSAKYSFVMGLLAALAKAFCLEREYLLPLCWSGASISDKIV
jgi:hypothetical protein